MAESDWDTVTVLRKKGPTAAQAKSKQVSANAVFRLCFRTFADQQHFRISTLLSELIVCNVLVEALCARGR